LTALAYLHDSLDWFSSAVEKVAAALAKELKEKEELNTRKPSMNMSKRLESCRMFACLCFI